MTLAALAIGGSRLTGGIKRSTSPHSRKAFFLAWAPGFAVLGDLVLLAVMIAVHPTRYGLTTGRPTVAPNGDPALAHALLVALGITAIVGWLLSVVCVAVAMRRPDIAPADLRFGRTVSVVVSALLVALLVAYTAWGRQPGPTRAPGRRWGLRHDHVSRPGALVANGGRPCGCHAADHNGGEGGSPILEGGRPPVRLILSGKPGPTDADARRSRR